MGLAKTMKVRAYRLGWIQIVIDIGVSNNGNYLGYFGATGISWLVGRLKWLSWVWWQTETRWYLYSYNGLEVAKSGTKKVDPDVAKSGAKKWYRCSKLGAQIKAISRCKTDPKGMKWKRCQRVIQ